MKKIFILLFIILLTSQICFSKEQSANDCLIVPGVSIGYIKLNTSIDYLIGWLGKPDKISSYNDFEKEHRPPKNPTPQTTVSGNTTITVTEFSFENPQLNNIYVYEFKTYRFIITANKESKTILSIRCGNENYKTAEGFGVGSLISDVKKAYPGGHDEGQDMISNGKAYMTSDMKITFFYNKSGKIYDIAI